MKKTIFLLALILPVCSLVAQPPVSSLPIHGLNESLVLQTGNDNDAAVAQTGLDNYSLITTTNGGNIDVVAQTGGNNYSFMFQNKGNAATVVQFSSKYKPGNVNLSWIEQSGKDNGAIVVQDHHGGDPGLDQIALEAYVYQSGNRNSATQLQTLVEDGELGGHWATIDQSGNDNSAFQQQEKHNNQALIVQTGNRNGAVQIQDVNVTPVASNNVAFVLQTGNDNVTATQVQNGEENWAVALVSGNGNSSTQVQGTQDGSARSDNGIAVVLQPGNRNDAVQVQDGTWNVAANLQTGNDNVAVQSQKGEFNLAGIVQDGNAGSATQIQSNDGAGGWWPPNVGIIAQTGGHSNEATQVQTIVGSDPVFPNLAGVYQDGSNNVSTQVQTGGYNLSGVMQDGNGNSSVVVQTTILPVP